jgi:hypothetical protein
MALSRECAKSGSPSDRIAFPSAALSKFRYSPRVTQKRLELAPSQAQWRSSVQNVVVNGLEQIDRILPGKSRRYLFGGGTEAIAHGLVKH